MNLRDLAEGALDAYGESTWTLAFDTEVLLCHKPEGSILAIRGTEGEAQDVISDLSVYWSPWTTEDGRSLLLHHGFAQAARGVVKLVKSTFERDCPIYLTGHSLGGAVASIAAAMLFDQGWNISGVATFGSPRPGDRSFSRWLDRQPIKVIRVVRAWDPVTAVPFLLWGFRHVGGLVYLFPGGSSLEPSWWLRARHRISGIFRPKEYGRHHAMAGYLAGCPDLDLD